jgi:hypothetical protein
MAYVARARERSGSKAVGFIAGRFIQGERCIAN